VSEQLDEWCACVGRPECDGAVLVAGVEDGVVGILSEGDGLSKVGGNFGDELTSRYVLVFDDTGRALFLLVG
jgi:hypothetical protein